MSEILLTINNFYKLFRSDFYSLNMSDIIVNSQADIANTISTLRDSMIFILGGLSSRYLLRNDPIVNLIWDITFTIKQELESDLDIVKIKSIIQDFKKTIKEKHSHQITEESNG